MWRPTLQVEFEGGKGSLFDLLEDLNADECLAKAQKIAGVTGDIPACSNAAFVFVKPHAVTPKVVELVKAKFAEESFTVLSDGAIAGETIEKDLLVRASPAPDRDKAPPKSLPPVSPSTPAVCGPITSQ